MFSLTTKYIKLGAVFFLTTEHGNRRTDEHGTLNFEVPDQYIFLTTEHTALKRSVKIIFRRKIGEAGSWDESERIQNGIFFNCPER